MQRWPPVHYTFFKEKETSPSSEKVGRGRGDNYLRCSSEAVPRKYALHRRTVLGKQTAFPHYMPQELFFFFSFLSGKYCKAIFSHLKALAEPTDWGPYSN